MKRFDNRTKEQFKKDIKFGTMIEQLWMKKCLPEIIAHNIYTDFVSIENNGADNTGEFLTKSNGNADFLVKTKTNSHPLEVKFAPTKGKITLKLNDVLGYKKQGADILIIYNSSNHSLKQPNHSDYQSHWNKIQDLIEEIRWGIIYNSTLDDILNLPSYPIPYMGNKIGFIIEEYDFPKFFQLRNFIHES